MKNIYYKIAPDISAYIKFTCNRMDILLGIEPYPLKPLILSEEELYKVKQSKSPFKIGSLCLDIPTR